METINSDVGSSGGTAESLSEVDEGCICRGNWRLIVSEVQHLFGKNFRNHAGLEFNFFGLVHDDDDYYYGMWHKENGLRLLSCVGSIEGHGYTLIA